jgi:hypothetical protein
MELPKPNLTRETKFAKSLYGNLPKSALHALKGLIQAHHIFVATGDVKYLNGGWYVTHSGLLRLAERVGDSSATAMLTLRMFLRSCTAPRCVSPKPEPSIAPSGLCQLIRQHQLDPNLVKAYATDFCSVKALRDATREQVENFVTHLADWAVKDRNALLCQLNSYFAQKEGAA